MPEIVGLIPARSGSKRIPGKNLYLLNGTPLLAFTIDTALESGIFSKVIVSTNDEEIASIALKYGALVPQLRPQKFALDSSPDIEWVLHALNHWFVNALPDFAAILRPTSPLRRPGTLIDAYQSLIDNPWADSLRAMEKVSQHPGKMWKVGRNLKAEPLQTQVLGQVPTHSSPTQCLEEVWVQNASLEISRVDKILETKLISGNNILAYQMPGYEGFDLNSPNDLLLLELLCQRNPKLLPNIYRDWSGGES